MIQFDLDFGAGCNSLPGTALCLRMVCRQLIKPTL
jgi:hypothetical protein